jgi:hypothetical protein
LQSDASKRAGMESSIERLTFSAGAAGMEMRTE